MSTQILPSASHRKSGQPELPRLASLDDWSFIPIADVLQIDML
jgi:hypothetical protein